MRVALVSDIHGNAVAFDAVLDDISDQKVDALVCLGDVATLGPDPGAVLDRLRRLGCLCVRGNHDDYLLDPDLVDDHSETSEIRDAINWARDQLTGPDLDQVAGFVDGANLDLDDGTVLTIFHGCPGSNTVDLLPTTSTEDLDRFLSEDRRGFQWPVERGRDWHRTMAWGPRRRSVAPNPDSRHRLADTSR